MKIDSRFIDPIIHMEEEGFNGKSFIARWTKEERTKFNAIYKDCLDLLTRFEPLNEDIITTVYPNWKEVMGNWEVVFSIGQGHEQEFFITSSDGKRIILLDLIRLKYSLEKGYDLEVLVMEKLTRQLVIDCISKTVCYPTDYQSQLAYLTYQYGLAYLLSYSHSIGEYHFAPLIDQYYEQAKQKWLEAYNEEDKVKQFDHLQDGISGHYWERYAMVTGKLFFAQHIQELPVLLKKDIPTIINQMIKD